MSFIAPLLVFLSIAGILYILLRKTPELKSWAKKSKASIKIQITNSEQKGFVSYAKSFVLLVWKNLKVFSKKLWRFVLEAKEVTAPGFKNIPNKVSKLKIKQNPLQKLNPNYDPGKRADAEPSEKKSDEQIDMNSLTDKQAEKKEQEFIQQIEDNPKDISAFQRLADLYFARKKYDEARETYEYLTKHRPEDYENYIKLAEVHERLKNYGEVIKLYKRAVEYKPEKVEWLVKLSELQEQVGELGDAVETLEKVVQLESESVNYRMRMASILAEAGKNSKAQKVLEKILQLEPTNEEARELLMEIKFE